jgi:hypothetical protein
MALSQHAGGQTAGVAGADLARARRSRFLHGQAAKLRAKAAPAAAFHPAIASVARNEKFLAARDAARPIDGIFTDFSMAVVDSLCPCRTTPASREACWNLASISAAPPR